MIKAVLVNLARNPREKADAPESMEELAGLVHAAGGTVVDKVFQVRPNVNPRTFIGEGKAEEIGWLREDTGADVVVFDHDLSPSQQRNLEKAVGTRVLDRTQLILDIFARRAHTNEGKLQVELAQLTYLLPRLTGRGKDLSRLGGGMNPLRGPGETKLETDRRRIEDRIARIKKEIRGLRKRRAGQRRSRRESLLPTVSLVGYTSVGKSTLFNRLAGEETRTSPQLFATLDPLVRRASFPDGLVYFLSDTVGFVKKLPHSLVTAFEATLEEVLDADVILDVVDVSSPAAESQAETVAKVLDEIGAGAIPRLRIGNKIDLLPEAEALLARNDHPLAPAVYVSARTGQGLDALKRRLRSLLFRGLRRFDLRIPRGRPELAESLPHWALILKKREDADYYVFQVMAEPQAMIPYEPFIEGERGEKA